MESGISTSFVGKLSESVGVGEASLRILLSLVVAYPVAYVHRASLHGKNAYVQNIYFIATGLALGYFNFGTDILHCLIGVCVTYLTLLFIGGTSLSVAITFVFNMGYLLTAYYYVGTVGYDINWTTPYCVLALRLIGLAFDLCDGQQTPGSLSSDSKKIALVEKPSLLEMCGHAFFPTSFLVGPQFPMKRYQDFIKGEFAKSSGSEKAALWRSGQAVFFLIVGQILGLFIHDEYVTSVEFGQLFLLKRLFLMGVWGRQTLYKYMSCWMLAESSCILLGVTYSGTDNKGEPRWNALENVKVSVLENATEFNHYIMSFNVNTNQWSAHYIYKRLKFLGSRLASQSLTLLFLAVWHGFHTGYYVSFAMEFLVIYLERDFASTNVLLFQLRPLVNSHPFLSTHLERYPWNVLSYIVLRLYTFVFMGWCLYPFTLMTFDRYWVAYANVNHVGLVLFVLYPIVWSPLLHLLLQTKKRKKGE